MISWRSPVGREQKPRGRRWEQGVRPDGAPQSKCQSAPGNRACARL